MYQLPMLISVRMSSVPRDTQSPWEMVWPRLYGFSTTSLFDTGAGAIGAGAEASAATAAGAEAASGSEAACAIAATGSTLSDPKASDRTSAAKRCGIEVFDMILLSV